MRLSEAQAQLKYKPSCTASRSPQVYGDGCRCSMKLTKGDAGKCATSKEAACITTLKIN